MWGMMWLFVFDGLALWMAYTTPLLVAELPEKLSCWVIVRSSPVERRGRPLGAPPAGSRCTTLIFLCREKPQREKYWCQRSRVTQIFWWINLLVCCFFLTLPLGKWVFPPPGLGGHWGPRWGPLGATLLLSPGAQAANSLWPPPTFSTSDVE